MKCRILSSTLLFRAAILTVKLKERKNKKYEKKEGVLHLIQYPYVI